MNQTNAFSDTVLDAIGASIQAAGGVKRVASIMYPTLDLSTAQARVRGSLNPDRPEKFGPEELVLIGQLARERGDNSLMEFLGRELSNEVKPIAATDALKQATVLRMQALLDEFKQLLISQK